VTVGYGQAGQLRMGRGRAWRGPEGRKRDTNACGRQKGRR
jgi:hypothetical protein